MPKLKPSTLKLSVTAFILAGFLVLPYLLNMLAPLPMDGTPDFDSKVRLIVQDELVKYGLLHPTEEDELIKYGLLRPIEEDELIKYGLLVPSKEDVYDLP